MRAEDWTRPWPEATGGGIDQWEGTSELGNTWMVMMWFGDEDSGGELAPDEFAIELNRFDPDARKWVTVTYDQLGSRAEVLAMFAQMQVTCD
jgi:hypothetical protein